MNPRTLTAWNSLPGSIARFLMPAMAAMWLLHTPQAVASTAVIEAEALLGTAKATAGGFQRQEMAGFGAGWGGNAQLFWRAPPPSGDGPRLIVFFDVPAAGSYDMTVFHTVAPDFGRYTFYVNDRVSSDVDGYHTGVALSRSVLGRQALVAGKNQLEVRVTGKNPASSGYIVGLDRIELTPAGGTGISPQLIGRLVQAQKSAPAAQPQSTTDPQPPPQPQPPPPPPPAVSPWTTQDILKPNIDVAAQYGLMRLLTGDPHERAVGSHILSAIENEQLGGIYQEDQKVPALRAQASGYGWWQILPRNAKKEKVNSTCMTDPNGSLPIFVMRKKAETNPVAYDQALVDAWHGCKLPPSPLRRYDKTLPGKHPPGKAVTCSDPAAETRLWVQVTAWSPKSASVEDVEGATVSVTGPGSYSGSAKTDLEGVAQFKLPRGGLYRVSASNLPHGYKDDASQGYALQNCNNAAMIDVGWSHLEDPCTTADREARSVCWNPEEFQAYSDCMSQYSDRAQECVAYDKRAKSEGMGDPKEFERCLAAAYQLASDCATPATTKATQCLHTIRAKHGCSKK